ncbi:MAG: DNA polymerase IV [Christensenellaceae bacterium]|nr:DNA polymerase IV [Christensenellaceae bacterium]
MERIIFHVDANSFYATVECVYRPELRGKALAVCGDPEARHGIVLTSSVQARQRGVKTGMAIWQARQLCPELITVPPDFPLYIHFSKRMRAIVEEYSDRVEAFGLDENWVDLSHPGRSMDDGERIAHELRRRIREELGITVSIGVSFGKVLAKLGSDMKKPDAVTVLRREDFREKTAHLPVGDLLYVGRATTRKLADISIRTIGQLAEAPDEVLRSRFGKNGLMIKAFALGQEDSPVRPCTVESAIKSVGNSTTTPHDIVTIEDARCVYYLLAESVGARLREGGFRARCVSISARTTSLVTTSHQCVLDRPTNITSEIADAACRLFAERYAHSLPMRSVGLQCAMLTMADEPLQLDMLGIQRRREQQERMDAALDGIRRRFGHTIVQRGVVLADSAFARINPKEDHVIHPVGFVP